VFAVTSQGDPRGRVVVVSPHLDDGVLSLGAGIASWARLGAHLVLLTVLGGDPESLAPTRGWDRRAGFETEGDAARARREEDRAACAVLGASPVWLPFGSVDYERHADDEEVFDAVGSAVEGADTVLLPGSPLTHADHAWLTRILVERSLPCERLGFYAEQPYTYRDGATKELPPAPGWLRDAVGSPMVFVPIRVAARHRLAKLRAIRRYRSQLGLLALNRRAGAPLLGLLWSEARRGGEAVAWVSGRR
jgi:LmbE family N-acetylglucosaminyl deacetylase